MFDNHYNSDDYDDWDDDDDAPSNLPDLIDQCLEALSTSTIDKLKFTENEFIHLMSHFSVTIFDFIVEDLAYLGHIQHPYSFDITIRLVEVMIDLNDMDSARSLLEPLLDSISYKSEAYYLYARTFIREGKFGCVDDSIGCAFEDPSADRASIYHMIAKECIDFEYYEKGTEYLTKALKHERNALFYYDMGYAYYKLGLHSFSHESYENSIELNPFSSKTWYGIGNLHYKEHNYERALDAYGYATALNRGFYAAILKKALVNMEQGKTLSAIDAFKEIYEINSDDKFALLLIAFLYFTIDNKEKSQKYYTKLQNLFVNNEEPNLQFGMDDHLERERERESPSQDEYIFFTDDVENIDFDPIIAVIEKMYHNTNNDHYLFYLVLAQYYFSFSADVDKNIKILKGKDKKWESILDVFIPPGTYIIRDIAKNDK